MVWKSLNSIHMKYRKNRRIPKDPKTTVAPATWGLQTVPHIFFFSAVLPIPAEIEKTKLTTFTRLITDPTTAEYNIIKRQIVIKDKSWIVDIRKLLTKFDLPSCHDLLINIPKKETWTFYVLKDVSSFYSARLTRESNRLPDT